MSEVSATETVDAKAQSDRHGATRAARGMDGRSITLLPPHGGPRRLQAFHTRIVPGFLQAAAAPAVALTASGAPGSDSHLVTAHHKT